MAGALFVRLIVLALVALGCCGKSRRAVSGGADKITELPYLDSRIESLLARLRENENDATSWADLGIVRSLLFVLPGCRRSVCLFA